MKSLNLLNTEYYVQTGVATTLLESSTFNVLKDFEGENGNHIVNMFANKMKNLTFQLCKCRVNRKVMLFVK